MTDVVRTPVTFGQLSVWRSIQDLPPERATSANLQRTWTLPEGCTTEDVLRALGVLEERHESLRTGYDLSGPRGIEQVLWPVRALEAELCELGDQADEQALAVTARLTAQPFDLARERPWRAAVITAHGVPKWLSFCIHHMAVDAASIGMIHEELMAVLAGNPLQGPAPTCRDLAAEQASEAWAARNAAAVRYWQRTMADSPAAPAFADETVVRWGELRSMPAFEATRNLASQLQISTHSVVLATFCRALAAREGTDRLLIGLIAGNRNHPTSQKLVSSLDQVTPLLVDADPATDFPTFAQRLHWSALRAYRHACYDVDALADIEREYGRNGVGSGFKYFFNFMPSTSGSAVSGPSAEQGWSIENRAGQRDNGFPLYFRAGESEQLWCTLREAAHDPAEQAEEQLVARTNELLMSFHRLLLAAAQGNDTSTGK